MEPDSPNAEARERILEYLQLDESDLLSIAGSYATEVGTMFAPHGQEEAGRNAFQRMQDAVHDKLCSEWNLCSKLEDNRLMDPVNLVAAIADAIAATTTVIPPLVVSTLVFKIGVRKFCACAKP
jgi:hypothetical protein